MRRGPLEGARRQKDFVKGKLAEFISNSFFTEADKDLSALKRDDGPNRSQFLKLYLQFNRKEGYYKGEVTGKRAERVEDFVSGGPCPPWRGQCEPPHHLPALLPFPKLKM